MFETYYLLKLRLMNYIISKKFDINATISIVLRKKNTRKNIDNFVSDLFFKNFLNNNMCQKKQFNI